MNELASINMDNIYLAIGAVVVMNIGALGTGLVFVIRLVFMAGRYLEKIEKIEKDLNNAFRAIKEIKKDGEQ